MRITPRDGRIAGTKVFHYLVMPDSAGSFLLPEVPYPYYDLAAGGHPPAPHAPPAPRGAAGNPPHPAPPAPPRPRRRLPARGGRGGRGPLSRGRLLPPAP